MFVVKIDQNKFTGETALIFSKKQRKLLPDRIGLEYLEKSPNLILYCPSLVHKRRMFIFIIHMHRFGDSSAQDM